MWDRHNRGTHSQANGSADGIIGLQRPSDETGGALSHAHDSLEQAPNKRAQDD